MTYTQDWIHNQDIIPHWITHLVPLKDRELNMLEIGSFEGRSAVWFLENVLLHEKSRITCVDTFCGDKQQVGMGVSADGILGRFIENTEPFLHKVKRYAGFSKDVLKKIDDEFDLIYIDGSHYQTDVLEDMVLAFDLLKKDGIMICDDYSMEFFDGEVNYLPRIAIDSFISVYGPHILVLHKGWQCILKKL